MSEHRQLVLQTTVILPVKDGEPMPLFDKAVQAEVIAAIEETLRGSYVFREKLAQIFARQQSEQSA